MKRIILLVFAAIICCYIYAKNNPLESYNIKRGIEAYDNKEYNEAQKYFEREIHENTKNGYAYMWLACCYRQRAEIGNALTSIDLAVRNISKKDSHYIWCLGTRSDIYLLLGDTVKAIADLSEAIKIAPKDKDCRLQRAMLYEKCRQYELSNADYNSVIKELPGYARSYVGLGRNNLAQKKFQAAIEDFSFAISLNSEYPEAYARRAEAYLKLGESDKATSDIVKALDLDDNNHAYNLMLDLKGDTLDLLVTKLRLASAKAQGNSHWYYYLGNVAEKQKDYKEAIRQYQKANEIDHDSYIDFLIADAYLSFGDYDAALNYIDQAISEDSTDYRYIDAKASILSGLDRREESIEMLNGYIKDNIDNEFAYAARMFTNISMHRYEEALNDASTLIALSPRPIYYQNRGRCYQLLGKDDKAMRDYQKVIELDTIPGRYSVKHYAYFFNGENDKAYEWMNRVLKDNPDADGKLYDAACLYALANDTIKALDYLQQAFDNGFVSFSHIKADSDLDNLRGVPAFIALLDKYEKQLAEKISKDSPGIVSSDSKVVNVPFVKDGGVTTVKCDINDLPLSFIFDSGASVVSISSVEATFMLKNGYLNQSDFIGKGRFVNADGDVSEGAIINLRHINFGGLELTDVRASVVKNQKAPLLLGQSVLQRLGRIEIDNENKQLKITSR